jgi:hypothetical protein
LVVLIIKQSKTFFRKKALRAFVRKQFLFMLPKNLWLLCFAPSEQLRPV